MTLQVFRTHVKISGLLQLSMQKKKLPLDSDILSSTSWLLPNVHDYGNLSQVMYLASCLSQVIKEEEKGPLGEEFIDYCAFELPPDFERTSSMDIDT